MLQSIDPAVWLACGYALLLLIVAFVFDKAARALVGRSSTLHHADENPDGGQPRQQATAPWPASEAERFHRGIACAVVLVAIAWPTVMLFSGRTVPEVLVLALMIMIVASASSPLWRHLRETPTGFPDQPPARGVPETREG